MSAELEWSHRREWSRERGEIEIKRISPAAPYTSCVGEKCHDLAGWTVMVGRVRDRGAGIEFDVCDSCKESWDEIFRKQYAADW